MKILIIIKALHYSYAGGIQTHVWKLAQELTKRGHELTIMTAQNLFKPKQPFYDQNIRIVPTPYISGNFAFFHLLALEELTFNYFALRKIRKWLTSAGDHLPVDVVHIQGRNGFLYAVCKKKSDPPAVTTFHGLIRNEIRDALASKNISWKRRWELRFISVYANLIEKQLAEKADRIIAVSHEMRRDLQRDLQIDEKKVQIIYNGIDTVEFQPCPEKRIPFRIVSVARLDPRKGLHFLIDAAQKLSLEFPQLTVHIVGDGEERQALARQITGYGLENKVILVGKKMGAALQEEYHQATLFVLPSLLESQGIVFMEAMACGLPVVGFDIGGVQEMIDSGVEGFLVKKASVNELAEAIKLLLMDTKLAETMGQRGRNRMEKQFRWAQIAAETEQVYRGLNDNFVPDTFLRGYNLK